MSVEHGQLLVDNGSQTTADQLAEMKAYGRQRLVCHLIDLALDTTTLAVVALLLAKPLDQWLQSWAVFQAAWIRLGVFFLVVAATQYVVSFPVTLHAGFILEHQFGLSRQTFWRWFRRDLLKLAWTVALGPAVRSIC